MKPLPKDIEILQLVSDGHRYREIATELSLTEDAVKNRMWRCFCKLGAINAPHAVAIALREGYIK